MTTIKLIDPGDFKVVRVISFEEPFLKKIGRVVYFRPLSALYQKATPDEFDNIMIEWLSSLNLSSVCLQHSDDICFDVQIPHIQRAFNGGRPTSTLELICHGNYTVDEMIGNGGVTAKIIKMKVFWDTAQGNSIIPLGGVVTFDKDKEKYFFDTIDTISSL